MSSNGARGSRREQVNDARRRTVVPTSELAQNLIGIGCADLEVSTTEKVCRRRDGVVVRGQNRQATIDCDVSVMAAGHGEINLESTFGSAFDIAVAAMAPGGSKLEHPVAAVAPTGAGLRNAPQPWAYAHGYVLPSLRDWYQFSIFAMSVSEREHIDHLMTRGDA